MAGHLGGTDRSCFAGFARCRLAHTQVARTRMRWAWVGAYKRGQMTELVVSRLVSPSVTNVIIVLCRSPIAYSIIYGHSYYIINKQSDNKLLKRSFHLTSSMVFESGAVTTLWTTINRAIGPTQDQPPTLDTVHMTSQWVNFFIECDP